MRPYRSKFARIFVASCFLLGATTASKWTLESKRDSETQLDFVSLKLRQGPTTLMVKCDKSEAKPWGIAINKVDENFDGGPMFRPGITKFDNGPSESTEWAYMGTIAFPDLDARRLLELISKSKALFIRLQKANGSKVNLQLDLSGSSFQIKKLKAACLEIGISS